MLSPSPLAAKVQTASQLHVVNLVINFISTTGIRRYFRPQPLLSKGLRTRSGSSCSCRCECADLSYAAQIRCAVERNAQSVQGGLIVGRDWSGEEEAKGKVGQGTARNAQRAGGRVDVVELCTPVCVLRFLPKSSSSHLLHLPHYLSL